MEAILLPLLAYKTAIPYPEELERLEKHLQDQQPDALFCIYSNPRHYVLLDWLQSSSFKGLPVFALPY